jgi:hypothetical protein
MWLWLIIVLPVYFLVLAPIAGVLLIAEPTVDFILFWPAYVYRHLRGTPETREIARLKRHLQTLEDQEAILTLRDKVKAKAAAVQDKYHQGEAD